MHLMGKRPESALVPELQEGGVRCCTAKYPTPTTPASPKIGPRFIIPFVHPPWTSAPVQQSRSASHILINDKERGEAGHSRAAALAWPGLSSFLFSPPRRRRCRKSPSPQVLLSDLGCAEDLIRITSDRLPATYLPTPHLFSLSLFLSLPLSLSLVCHRLVTTTRPRTSTADTTVDYLPAVLPKVTHIKSLRAAVFRLVQT